MSDQQHQQQQQRQEEGKDGREDVLIFGTEKPSVESQRLKTLFDDMESQQLDRLDESGKGLIERVGTFLGVLFAITVLSSNFPPPFLKGNAAANIAAKTIVIASLFCFLLSLGSAIWAAQVVRSYRRSLSNMTVLAEELQKMIRHKKRWLQLAHLLFALGVVALAVLLIVVVWSA